MLLFLRKTNVPSTPVVVPVINDSKDVYTATVVTSGKVIVGAMGNITTNDDDDEDTV